MPTTGSRFVISSIRVDPMDWLPLPILIFPGFLIVMVVVISWARRRRRRAFEAAAVGMGLLFRAKDGDLETEGIRDVPSFEKTGSAWNRFRNTLRSGDLVISDWSRIRKSGKRRSVRTQTISAFRRPGRRLPRFVLREAENAAPTSRGRFGHDIAFPDDPSFTRRLTVSGVDERGIRELFDGPMRSRLRLRPGLTLEGGGEWIVCYFRGHRLPAETLRDFLQTTREITEMIQG